MGEERIFLKKIIMKVTERVNNFWNNNYIEYKSNGDKNIKIETYHQTNILTELIDLRNSDTWKIQLTTSFDFTSSRDVDEECVMLSNNSNIEFTLYDNGNK